MFRNVGAEGVRAGAVLEGELKKIAGISIKEKEILSKKIDKCDDEICEALIPEEHLERVKKDGHRRNIKDKLGL
jgi:hypothetical protein